MPLVNTALTLEELPAPPIGKIGWPWTEQSEPLPERMPDGSEWLRISIVTPSYNQGQFIEETIRSVLLQGYPNVEYIIIDGGSTDNTVEVIKKYEQYIAYWVSEPDQGQSNALNKGFIRATGQLIGWQNSDDYYHPQAFIKAAKAALELPDKDIIYGSTDYVDIGGTFLRGSNASSFDFQEMLPWVNMCNQSMFFKNKIFKENNFIDESWQHCMDYEFFWRLALKGYKFHFLPDISAGFRQHELAKGSSKNEIINVELLKLYKLICRQDKLPIEVRQKALQSIQMLALHNFATSRILLFRKSVYVLGSISGIKYINSEIIIKYFLSFLNIKILEKIRQIKHQKYKTIN
jgi:glycosyltransferase involved in cell wall biosynthesis